MGFDLITYALLRKLIAGKQDALVSGETIKTINGASILGSGDMTIAATDISFIITDVILDDDQEESYAKD